MLAERFIPGREITVAVMGDRALGVTEITSDRGFYDYTAKYAPGGSHHLCPRHCRRTSMPRRSGSQCWPIDTLGCRGVSRADLRYDDTRSGERGRLYVLEVNTQPGMTADLAGARAWPPMPASVSPNSSRWMVENATCDA